jgi:PAS domain S-box-containing protein
VHEPKQLELELARLKRRLDALTGSTPVGIYELDGTGDCTFVNDYWCDLAGVEAEAGLGRGWVDVIHPDDLDRVVTEWMVAAAEEREFRLEYRYLRPDGREVWVSGRAVAVRDPEGELSGFLGTVADVTERHEAEQASRRLAAIVESTDDAIIATDLDANITSWNRGAERIFGYTAEEIIGRSVDVLRPPDESSRSLERIGLLASGQRVPSYEATRMRKDWKRIDVSVTLSPIEDVSGEVIGASAIIRDISKSKAVERRLAENARHFELSHDLAATCGFDGYFKQLNGAWRELLGWRQEELLANPFLEIIHPEDRAAAEAEVERLARGETTTEFQVRLATAAGGWRWFEWTASPDPEGEIFYASGREVTDRRAMELELKRERRELREAQRIASVGSWRWDLRNGDVEWSEQNFRNHGLAPEGQAPSPGTFIAVLHPEDRERIAEQMKVAAGEAREFTIVYRVVHPAGETRFLELRGTPQAGGRVLAGTTRDITAERDAERVKDEFFGLISHELRTPLTSIIGYTELLVEAEAANLSDEGRRFLEVIERNSRRELSLVGDLLMLTRIEAGVFQIDVDRANLATIASGEVDAARPAADRSGVALVADVEPTPTMDGDSHRLAQVAENLISNALKFTNEGGTVTVRVRTVGAQVSLEVSDNGIGIPAHEHELLFDRMYRAREAERRHVPGTGLGLTIVKAIVEAHGGTIALESELGEGTTFHVELPARRPSATAGDRDQIRSGAA